MSGWIGMLIEMIVSWGANAAYNSREASKTRKWQSNMSMTAHQREMQDLSKAGLNPILAYSKGAQGATTPSGATASTQKPDVANSAMAFKFMNAQLRKLKAEATKTENEATILEKELPKSEVIADFWERILKPLYGTGTRDVPPIQKAYNDVRNSVYGIRDTIQSPFVPELKRNKKTKRKPFGHRTKAKNPYHGMVN